MHIYTEGSRFACSSRSASEGYSTLGGGGGVGWCRQGQLSFPYSGCRYRNAIQLCSTNNSAVDKNMCVYRRKGVCVRVGVCASGLSSLRLIPTWVLVYLLILDPSPFFQLECQCELVGELTWWPGRNVYPYKHGCTFEVVALFFRLFMGKSRKLDTDVHCSFAHLHFFACTQTNAHTQLENSRRAIGANGVSASPGFPF